MTAKIFIDGEHGTTGLQIGNRLEARSDIEILSLPHDQRRSIDARQEKLHEADIAILCLPDDAARESVALAAGSNTRIIDASSAHRTHNDWVFGFQELANEQAEKIANAQFVSNPGCYSTGAIALINPLIRAGLLAKDYPLTINAISGYTGGGKGLIAQIENDDQADHISATYFSYALGLQHKHVPEIVARCGLSSRPIFTPGVGRFSQGMQVQVPLFCGMLEANATPGDVVASLENYYASFDGITVMPPAKTSELVRLDPEALVGTNDLHIYIQSDDKGEQINLVAQLDNLGKGASGAAVQNLDLMLGNQ